MVCVVVVFVVFGLMAIAGFIDINELNKRAMEEDKKKIDPSHCAMGRVWYVNEHDGDAKEAMMQDIRDNG